MPAPIQAKTRFSPLIQWIPGHKDQRPHLLTTTGKSMGHLFRAALAATLLLVSQFAAAQQATGKLVFDIKPFTSEVPLKKKIETQLQSGGIEWGVKDGQLVVAVLNKRFVAFDITHMT